MSFTQVNIDNVVDRSNRITRINLHTFQLMVEGAITIEGTYDQVRAAAIHVEFDNVDEAMHAIVMSDHSAAIFGINRTFMYTSDRIGYKPTKLHVVQ